MTILGLITACVGLVVLIALHRRDQKRVRQQRSEFFADCLTALDRPEITRDAFGYPRLSGWFEGVPVRADVVVDCVALRKLPSLWLRLTVEAPVETGAVLDVMMRPSGAEFFSAFERLPDRLDTPADWPERAVIRTDDVTKLPPPEAIVPYVDFLGEPKAKELVIAPRGVRIVWQADEAQRGDYMLLRQARFEVARFDRDRFCDLLRRCTAIRHALAAEQSKEIRREAAA